MVPVSRAGEDGVGWREVVEVEVFVVGAVGLEGVGVFASMSMVVVVVVVQRTKWSVLLLLLLLFRFLLESLGGISVYVYILPSFSSSSSSFSSSSSPPSFTLQQGARVKKGKTKQSRKKGQDSQVKYIPSLYRPLRHKKKASSGIRTISTINQQRMR